ncbi:MAG: metalloregulator ArsR/SmtB family transcription factor [Rickettsiales bacterium]|nr:metalloregulator ArsR/SmtB family transcription factor [Rickettsiales bacterium]
MPEHNLSKSLDALRESAIPVADFLKLVANSNRLLILCRLAQSDACVSELEEALNLSQPALSQHLARLRQEGVLETRREGQQIFYSIRQPLVHDVLAFLNQISPNVETAISDT